MATKHNKFFYKSHIIVLMIILFFVIVGIIIYITINNFNQDYNYNINIKNRQKISAQGYELIANIPDNIKVNMDNIYRVKISKKNQNIINASIIAYFYYADNKKYDFHTPLVYVGNGYYQGKISLPLNGVWSLVIKAKKDDYLQISAFDLFAKNN